MASFLRGVGAASFLRGVGAASFFSEILIWLIIMRA